MRFAPRLALKTKNVALSVKLFLSGTSKGGYVTLATQMVMERDFPQEFPLTAVMAASGPYNATLTMDTFIAQPDSDQASKSLPATMTLTALNKTYFSIYTNPSTVFNPPWSANVDDLVLGTHSENELFTQCFLPYNLKDYPSKVFPNCDQETDKIPLLQADFVASYQAKPNNPNYPAYQARADVEKQNLLRDWTAKAALALCYGDLDSMATPNAQAAEAYFRSRSFQALTMENVQVETSEPIHTWIVTQSARYTDGAGYHGKVEAPACVSWGKHQVFDRLAF